MNFAKYVLPVVVGTMSAMILITLGQMFLASVYHLGPTDGNAPIDVSMIPAWAFVMLLANYMVCSFIAGIISSLIAKRETPIPAVVIGIVLTLAGIYNSLSMPHPAWFSIVNLVVYLPFAYAGFLIIRRQPAGMKS